MPRLIPAPADEATGQAKRAAERARRLVVWRRRGDAATPIPTSRPRNSGASSSSTDTLSEPWSEREHARRDVERVRRLVGWLKREHAATPLRTARFVSDSRQRAHKPRTRRNEQDEVRTRTGAVSHASHACLTDQQPYPRRNPRPTPHPLMNRTAPQENELSTGCFLDATDKYRQVP